MTSTDLFETIDRLYESDPESSSEEETREVLAMLLERLEAGEVRSARPVDGGWEAVPSVKRGILLGFRVGELQAFKAAGPLTYSDKDTFPPQNLPVHQRNIRVVPGGSAVRRGAYIGNDVTVMPPAYVNVGAYVGDGTMVDSHALVGSCAQIGEGVHLSAGAQIGGVLEPVGQQPVVIEDGALIGGNTGVYEGVRVGAGAVLAAGCVVTGSTPVFDLVNETKHTGDDGALEIPPSAVVVPGTRPASGEWADEHGLQMNALIIAKYRDEQTDTQTALEEALR